MMILRKHDRILEETQIAPMTIDFVIELYKIEPGLRKTLSLKKKKTKKESAT